MKVAQVSGSAKDIGFQIGKAFQSLIMKNCSQFCPPIGTTGLSSLISHYERKLSKVYPSILDELDGIAVGANVAYEQVFYLSFPMNWELFTNGCTQLVFCHSDKGPLLGKSQDVGLSPEEVFCSIKRDTSNSVYHIATAGTIGSYAGMNSSGLCIGYSTGYSYEYNSEGIWFPLLIRLVLEQCHNVEEAIFLLEQYSLDSSGVNFALVDSSGRGVVVEKTPYMQRVRWAAEGAISATNHVEHPDTISSHPVVEENELYIEIEGRRLFLNVVIKDQNFTLSKMMEVFQTHSPPGQGSICSHNYGEGGDTLWSVIFAPNDSSAYISDMYPCKTGFSRLHFKS